MGGPDADPAAASFGMRLPIAAGESLRLWNLVELCEEERRADIEEACRLVYVAVSRAEERLILSGTFKPSDLEATEVPRPSHSALKLLLPGPASAWLERRRCRDRPRPPRLGDRWIADEGVAEPEGDDADAQRRSGCRAPRARAGRRGPPDEAQTTLFDRTEPLLARLQPSATTGQLSSSALASYGGCHYRFYVERVVGIPRRSVAGEPDQQGDDGETGWDELSAPSDEPRERSLAIGNAVHALLETSARLGGPPRTRLRSKGSSLERISPPTRLRGTGSGRWSTPGSGRSSARSSTRSGRAFDRRFRSCWRSETRS